MSPPHPIQPCSKDCLKIRFILYKDVNVEFKISILNYTDDNLTLSNITIDDTYWIKIEPNKDCDYIWCTPYITLNNNNEYILGIGINTKDIESIPIDAVSLKTYTGNINTTWYVYDSETQTLTINAIVYINL